MKMLVTGAAGMLGSSLVPCLQKRDHSVLATDISFLDKNVARLDVREYGEMVEVAEAFRPDLVFHLDAETDLEVCEMRPDYAYQENLIGTQNACKLCHELDIPLVYISTAGVFDGTKRSPYNEFDHPNPINVYGRSKYYGEQIIRQTVPRHFVVRAGWMIGGVERDKKFVSKIVEQLRGGAKRIYAVDDKLGTPTYAPAFSEILLRIVEKGFFGTYHLACKGRASRYEVAEKILTILGQTDVEITAVKSDFFARTYFAPRPLTEEMENFMLELRGMNDMPHWTEALKEYLVSNFHDVLLEKR